MEAIFVLIGLVFFFGPWILIFILFGKLGTLRSQLHAIQRELGLGGKTGLSGKQAGNWPVAAEKTQAASTADAAISEAVPDHEPDGEIAGTMAREETGPEDLSDQPAADISDSQPDEPAAAEGAEARPARFSVPDMQGQDGPPPETDPGSASTAEALERSLASKWLVWLGAIAISLAGIFLTAYAIEQGWLGPAVRVALGVLLGLALAIGGEWLRRRPFQKAIATIQPDYVPPALSAAGIFTTYASIYVGYAFYDLYPALLAFALLAIAGLGAIALSLLQGWFVALVGLVGSFLTPALIPSDAPSALALFSYLIAVLAASCALVRYRAWWLLGYAGLALATLWSFIWFTSAFADGDTLIVGAYALAVGVLFQAIRHGLPLTETPLAFPARSSGMPGFTSPEALGWAGLAAAGLMVFALVRVDGYTALSLVILGVFVLAVWWLACREPFFDLSFASTAAMVCLLFVAWHLPHLVEPGVVTYPDHPGLKLFQPVVQPPPAIFTRAVLVFGTLFGLGGFLALLVGDRRAQVFAGVSAIAPAVLFTIAYWRYLDFDQDVRWAAVALVLAGVALAAATFSAKRRDDPKWLVATGLYAAAVTAYVGLGFAMTAEEAWLTVALALQLPALAWIDSRLGISMLRRIAEIIAAIVLVRLVFNPAVLDYALPPGTLFNWILYGYGVPCLAFLYAARTFAATTAGDTRSSGDERLLAFLQAGALAFFAMLLSFQIRYWVSGSLSAPYDSFLEQSLQSISWLAISYVLMARRDDLRIGRWPVPEMGARILFALAALQVLLLQLVFNNPFSASWMPEERRTFIGEWPVFDYLLLAYLAPAGFALAFHLLFRKRGWPQLSLGAGIASLILLFAYVSAEVRHWYQGATLQWDFISDAENYAVSAAWLVLALALLAAAIAGKSRELRYASLAVLLLAVAKVFLFDAADLTGLYRVAAFLGLGFSLVGIGYIYQRFVFTETAGVAIPDGPPDDAGEESG
jgi:uncharacterized membrane protein